MGLFQHRPEDPVEWAGLPSEPLRDETTAERLTDAAAAGAASLDLLGSGGPSIEIPVEAPADSKDDSE